MEKGKKICEFCGLKQYWDNNQCSYCGNDFEVLESNIDHENSVIPDPQFNYLSTLSDVVSSEFFKNPLISEEEIEKSQEEYAEIIITIADRAFQSKIIRKTYLRDIIGCKDNIFTNAIKFLIDNSIVEEVITFPPNTIIDKKIKYIQWMESNSFKISIKNVIDLLKSKQRVEDKSHEEKLKDGLKQYASEYADTKKYKPMIAIQEKPIKKRLRSKNNKPSKDNLEKVAKEIPNLGWSTFGMWWIYMMFIPILGIIPFGIWLDKYDNFVGWGILIIIWFIFSSYILPVLLAGKWRKKRILKFIRRGF